jgi:plasmid replication initiation protein
LPIAVSAPTFPAMPVASRRRAAPRHVLLDRALEGLPLFRLSDSADDVAITYPVEGGGRWRVLPSPGDRLPGTFDQDVYVELLHRWQEAGSPRDGAVTFTLHAFLRSMGRRVDGRTYELLRGALVRLERTTLESTGAYHSAAAGGVVDLRFSLLTAVVIERRRESDRDQLALFPTFAATEPGVARVTIAPVVRENIAAAHVVALPLARYLELGSPVARRLCRLLEVAREEGRVSWRLSLEALADRMPLVQRYPSHLQRVLLPAHEMLAEAGLIRSAEVRQEGRAWVVEYVLARRG